MASNWTYKIGQKLGVILFLTYMSAAIIGVTGSAFGLDDLVQFKAWYYWLGIVVAGLLVLWFIPRPVDVLVLAPLAFYAGHHSFGLTYTMSGIIVGLPVLLTVLFSLGKKDES